MDTELWKMVVSQGIFACLFTYLLLYVLKTNSKREDKYQTTIDKNQTIIQDLANKFNVIEKVQKDVEDIKNKIER